MEYSTTIFKNVYDNKTHRTMSFKNWEGFEQLLYSLARQPGYKPKKDERFKDGSPLISPAVYKPNETRRNVNVVAWGGWAALDIDDYKGSFEDALKVFSDVRHVCYSSASSTKSNPKFRVVLPTTKRIESEDIRHFWYALNQEFNELGDPQTKDLSRMYYVPALYPNSYQFIFSHNDAPMIDPSALMGKHKYIAGSMKSLSGSLSSAIRTQLAEYKKTKLTNTDFRWSSYHDCPFVNKRLIAEYRAINDTGWYAKMYQIMMSIAGNAINRGYPITPNEIACITSEIDNEHGGWYHGRPMIVEAERAIAYACSNS